MLLSAALVVTQLPAAAMAEDSAPEDGSIASFAALDSDVVKQTVPMGTAYDDLVLPDTVTAKVYHVTEDTVIPDKVNGGEAGREGGLGREDDAEKGNSDTSAASPSDADESVSGDGAGQETDGGKTVTTVTTSEEEIPVTWDSAPAYDGDAAGEYVFTADADGYILSDGAAWPAITMTVGTETPPPANGALTKTVTGWMFVDGESLSGGELPLPGVNADHPADFDTVVSLLPTQISGTVDGGADPVTVDITGWSCPEYKRDGDDHWPLTGDYTFTAEPEAGYACEPAPTVKVTLGGGDVYDFGGLEISGTPMATQESDGQIKLGNGDYTISGTWAGTLTGVDYDHPKAVITVPSGVTAEITLKGAVIDVSGTGYYAGAFAVEADGTANITLSGTNALTSGSNRAGLGAPKNAVVTITGGDTDSLTATGGAGIGGGSGDGGGDITISGGRVTAMANSDGAGIGGGYSDSIGGDGGDIKISGGTVMATGGNGAGIGGGNGLNPGGSGGIIHISDSATVTATANGGAGIGGGIGSSGGDIHISGSATVTATGGSGAGIGGGIGGNGGNITIRDRVKVTASSASGAGIGGGEGLFKATAASGGSGGSGGRIAIQDGAFVTATGGGHSAGIGGAGGEVAYGTIGDGGAGGEITVQNNAVVFAAGAGGADAIGGGMSGDGGAKADGGIVTKSDSVVFEDKTGTVHGDVTLPGDLEIPGGSTLTIPDGSSLKVPDGVTLTNNGDIKGPGPLTGDGNFGGAGTYTHKVSLPAATVTGITPPAAGAAPDTDAAVDADARYTAGTVTWKDGNTTYTSNFANGIAYTASVTLTVKDANIYQFTSAAQGTVNGNPATISGGGEDITLSYTFPKTGDKPAHTVTVTGGTGGGSYQEGAAVTITATVPGGQQFTGWTIDPPGVTFTSGGKNTETATFTMPANNVTAAANYKDSGSTPGGGSSGGDGGSSSSSAVVAPKGSYTVTGDKISQSISRSNLKGLADAGKSLTLSCGKAGMTFAPAALKAILAAVPTSAGNITFAAAPADLSAYPDAAKQIGAHPVYDFTISYKDGTGNTVTVPVSFPAGSASITLTYLRTAAETEGSLFMVYVDGKGAVTWLDKSSYDNGRLLAEVPHFSTYGVAYKAPAPVFTDISGHWAKQDIEFVAARGLLSGTDDGLFSPDGTMTRGMFVTALGRLAGINPDSYQTRSFTDVKADAYYAAYVEWAAQKNIVKGTGDKLFSPDAPVTREQMAVMMTNYAGQMGYSIPTPLASVTFADSDKISAWAAKEVAAMQRAGIVKGKDGNRFDPQASATRAEVSAVLRRFVEIVIDPATATGWVKNDSGHWLYYKGGTALTGWQTIGKQRYFFNADGVMHEGWKQDTDTNKWYYWTNAGAAAGWREIDGKWYYFDGNGVMAVNTKVDGHEIGPDGARKEN